MQSFLSKAGSVALTAVKHVPTRALLWALIGLLVGALGVTLSFAIGSLTLGRGALILGYLVVIPLLIPLLGAALFGLHGLHRGAARAVLELDRKFGLVSYLVDGVLSRVEQYLGASLGNLPLQRIEGGLKQAVDAVLGADGAGEERGLLAYVLRRARRALVPRIESTLLTAYREEQREDGSGGGVSIVKVRERTLRTISERLPEIVMSPLNKQLAVFMTLYVLLATGWWFWLFLLIRGLSKLSLR